MDVNEVRKCFPALTREIYGRPLVYFDNAATSQRPESVMDMLRLSGLHSNANIHRAVHTLSSEATDLYEKGREAVRSFINASSGEEIVLTSGTTASINILAHGFCGSLLQDGDVILLSEAEHHSNMIPWMLCAAGKGIAIKYIPVDGTGHLDMESYVRLLESSNVRLVSVPHISNVLGIVNPISEIISLAHEHGAYAIIDGAQGIVHEDVDVQRLDCDFYVFSGHKVYAATGTGVLYGKSSLLAELPPLMGGGEMVGTVTYQGTTFAPLPLKFEAGTPNFAGCSTFSPALEMASLCRDEGIRRNVLQMTEYLESELLKIPGLHLLGTGEGKAPVFSFAVEGAHHEDIALLLDKMGVEVRSGLMCAEPVINKFGYTGVVRASLAPYNTVRECEYFMRCLVKALRMLS